MQTIGVIGGSGLYEMPGLKSVREVRVRTPFGEPSDAYITGVLDGAKLVFLPRHGRGHRLLPSELNFRANIWGFKKLGCERVISLSAVGSMREEIAPGHMVVVDQFIDRTQNRVSTFFGDGVVGHVPFSDPVCGELAAALATSAAAEGATVHHGGTYVCIEGPAFSTRAESQLYRQWGVHVVGMTNMPEAKLAREAELCYATLALPTDYDCWHVSAEPVTVDAVVQVLKQNVELARRVVRAAVARLRDQPRGCGCSNALQNAIMTAPEKIPAAAWKRLELIAGRYLPKQVGRSAKKSPARRAAGGSR